jgi:HEAT repeat protein
MTIRMLLICCLCLASVVSRAQTQQGSTPAHSTADANTDNSEEPDAPVTQSATANKGDIASGTTTAWDMLRTAVSESKPQVQQARIDAITALGTLSDFEQAQKMLRDTAQNSDRYVRFAAVAAMGASKAQIFVPDLKAALKDSAPEVSFAAAVGLWKMNDRSGESILYAVLAGDRKVKQGAVGSGLHQADQDLHTPSKLAEIGAEQGAYALLGPVGFGVDAFRMMHKGNNGNSPRVLTATLLADDKSPATMEQFLDALDDRDSFVRTAAARQLGDYRGKQVTDALQGAFDDPKPVVRLMAAASYIRASQPVTTRQKPRHRNGITSKNSSHER